MLCMYCFLLLFFLNYHKIKICVRHPHLDIIICLLCCRLSNESPRWTPRPFAMGCVPGFYLRTWVKFFCFLIIFLMEVLIDYRNTSNGVHTWVNWGAMTNTISNIGFTMIYHHHRYQKTAKIYHHQSKICIIFEHLHCSTSL